MAARVTFLWIKTWRRLARQLAQRREPLTATALNALLRQERVPMELRPAFRAVVGRWRSYHAVAVLSPTEARELVDLTNDPLHKRSHAARSEEDKKRFKRQLVLERRHYGSTVSRRFGRSAKLGKPGLGTLIALPRHLRGLWEVLDRWGAAQHDVSLPTFRRWRLVVS
jgi:hypothetical protein